MQSRDQILDAWRGVAIVGVLLHHFFYFHYIVDNPLVRFVAERSGPMGVKIFFVVSGYIITRLMLEEEERRGYVSLYAFYVRRIFRILPAYIGYLLCVAGAAALGFMTLSGADLLHALMFICNTGVDCSWQVVHTWTLAVEMQFYLLWPIVFVLLPARLRAAALGGIIVLLLMLSAFELDLARGWIDNAASFACIALGALYATSSHVREWVRHFGLWALALGAVVTMMLSAAHWGGVAHALYRALVPLSLFVVVFAAYRFEVLAGSRAVTLLSYLGLVSYSLYLWQQLFAAPAVLYLVPSVLEYPVLLVVCTLVSYFVLERPGIMLGKRLLRRRVSTTEQHVPGL